MYRVVSRVSGSVKCRVSRISGSVKCRVSRVSGSVKCRIQGSIGFGVVSSV